MFLFHVPGSTAWDPAPSPAPRQPGAEGLPHFASQTWGWWLRFPMGWKKQWGELTHPGCAWKGRGVVSCSLHLSLPIWGPSLGSTPELIPKGWKTEVTGRSFSLRQGCLCRCDDTLGISQRKLCFTGNMTKNFSHLWTLFTFELHPPPFLEKISGAREYHRNCAAAFSEGSLQLLL